MPHVIDTILLVSAIALALLTAQYPFVQPWLTAKIKILALVGPQALGLPLPVVRRLQDWFLAQCAEWRAKLGRTRAKRFCLHQI